MTLDEWLASQFPEVAPMDFYRGIFPTGSLEKKGEYVKGEYTAIVVAISQTVRKTDGRKKIYRYTMTDDLEVVQQVTESNDFCVCAPISYAGKRRTADNARVLYAIAIDLDHIIMDLDSRTGIPIGARDLWYQITNDREKYIPRPTFIVSSGSGLHLYYVLQEPVKLFPDMAKKLQEIKRALTVLIWNDFVVDIKDVKDIQQEGIYQGLRMPGTVTKKGTRAKAYLTGDRVTLEYLNLFAEVKMDIQPQYKTTGQKTLAQAKELWPEWYERRIVQGKEKLVWHTNRRVYDWWLNQIKHRATVGHRYYCMMLLAVYAQKCSHYDAKHNPNPVTREELERDCFELLELFDGMTESEDNHFTTDDILTALEAFDERWTTYPRNSIEYKSGFHIEANKRNGRKQETHLRIARNTLAVLNDESSKSLQGAKDKGQLIENWLIQNPNGIIADCARETGLSRTTISKYWKEYGGGSKGNKVVAWRENNPKGTKSDCIRETGLSKKTVYKYWEDTEETIRSRKAAKKELTLSSTDVAEFLEQYFDLISKLAEEGIEFDVEVTMYSSVNMKKRYDQMLHTYNEHMNEKQAIIAKQKERIQHIKEQLDK